MSEAGSGVVLSWDEIQRAIEFLQREDDEYIFQWRGVIYTGVNCEACLMAAIRDDPVLTACFGMKE